jgi:uncharacterized phage protein gp47/JayE
MSAVTESGFVRTRLDERLAQLVAAMQAIFGNDIDIDPDSLDGQQIGIYAEAIANLDQLAEEIYNGFSPQGATSLALSRLVQLNGIRRIPGLYSTVTLTATGTEATIIPAGSLVRNPTTNVQFLTLADATIPPAGTVQIAARATEVGALASLAGTITKIDTPIYGWQTVTNAADAIPGRLEETDEQLRIRRAQSTATPGISIVDSIYGGILELADVRHVVVYENDQDVADPVTGQAPHSINAIVDGGQAADIAQIIYLKKTIGTTSLGAEVVVINDTQGNPHEIRFARPEDVDIYVEIDLHTRPGWPVDGAQRIKDAIVAWALENQSIGDELVYSNLYSPINSVPGSSIDSLFIGTAPSPAGTANIAVDFDQITRFDTARIVVNVL